MFVLRSYATYPYLPIGWFWYLGAIVPVSGIIQAGLWPELADRFAYIPFIGIYIMLVWGGYDLNSWMGGRKIMITTILALFMIMCGTLTRLQATYWTNSVALFENASRISPDSYAVQVNLGNALARRGLLESAMEHYFRAITIEPKKANEVHNNIGAALITSGRYRDAVYHLNLALKINPNYTDARKNLETALKKINVNPE
jgi:tetratricopeptide (TPR) repeat protein